MTARSEDYAGGDEDFARWLAAADRWCMGKVGVSIHDLADWVWRDGFESHMTPQDAVIEALSEDDTYGPHIDELELGGES